MIYEESIPFGDELLKSIKSRELINTIISVYVECLETGEKEMLTTKVDSCCHFFEPIYVENHKIIFRLDWSDLDGCNKPTLDADFYDAYTEEKLTLSGDRRDAHHTNAKENESRTYEWEFRTLNRTFKVTISWNAPVKESIGMHDDALPEVIRKGVKIDD